MASKTQIAIGANIDEAVDALGNLQTRIGDLSRRVREALQAMRSADAAYVTSFKNSMQTLVDSKQVSLQQALGFDIQYSAKVFEQEQMRLAAIRDSNRASLGERRAALTMMQAAEARYIAQSSGEYRHLADVARSHADRIAQSYQQAFDRIGGTVQHTFNEILTGQTTWARGMTRMTQEVQTFFLEQVEAMAAKWAASGLASLVGGGVSSAVGAAQATGASGLGAGLTALLGINQPGGLIGTGLFSGEGAGASTALAGQAAAETANTTALGASTAAMTALTAALTGTTATSTASAGAVVAGGATAAGAAGGSGLFSWLGGLFAFSGGGIVPSAAGGWAVPNFAGATPALLHAREMVLPADISQGLQGMIAAGGGAGGAHFHAHFHGPADAPSVSRWFRDNLKSNAGALRDLFRQNALTPRSF